MEETAAGWTVIDREQAVLCTAYAFSKAGRSTTYVARMRDGKLMVVSPSTGLTDEAAAELATFGDVGAIVANNGFHHLGQVEWRERFPSARCFAPTEAAARIAKKNPATLAFEPMSALADLLGDDVGFRDVPNSKCGETWFWARIEGGYAWYMSDVLANLPKLPPWPIKWLFQWTGSGPGYRVFNLGLKFIVKDRTATLRLLLDDLAAHEPTVVVPAHGGILATPTIAADTRALIEGSL